MLSSIENCYTKFLHIWRDSIYLKHLWCNFLCLTLIFLPFRFGFIILIWNAAEIWNEHFNLDYFFRIANVFLLLSFNGGYPSSTQKNKCWRLTIWNDIKISVDSHEVYTWYCLIKDTSSMRHYCKSVLLAHPGVNSIYSIRQYRRSLLRKEIDNGA